MGGLWSVGCPLETCMGNILGVVGRDGKGVLEALELWDPKLRFRIASSISCGWAANDKSSTLSLGGVPGWLLLGELLSSTSNDEGALTGRGDNGVTASLERN